MNGKGIDNKNHDNDGVVNFGVNNIPMINP